MSALRVVDLSPVTWYTKLELATRQLDRAIALLLDEADSVCAITLAGAAEEILGEMVKLQGGVSAHQVLIDDCVSLSKQVPGQPAKARDFHEMFAHFRNELKHYREGTDIGVSADCAYPVIDRAIENLRQLGVPASRSVRRYISDQWYG